MTEPQSAVTVKGLLAKIREVARDEHGKGRMFERFFQEYLRVHPPYSDMFEEVWLWGEWPDRWSTDVGIDLVARTTTGDYWAIQCKFYAPDQTVSRSDIDAFFTASGRRFATSDGEEHNFAQRLIVSTTDHWSSHAEKALENQTPPVARLFLRDLEESRVDWSAFDPTRATEIPLVPTKSVRPHQEEAIQASLEKFESDDRGKLIMACGTGKTFTSLRLMERMGAQRVLVLAPSISLVGQTLREWAQQAEAPFHAFAVCSDTKVSRETEDLAVHDLAFPATTDPETLGTQFERTDDGRRRVVFSTYQSIETIEQAQAAGVLPEFDLIVCDEAHRTTGLTLPEDDKVSHFVRVHDNRNVAGAKRLYMTATPRIYAEPSKKRADERDAAMYSMDDPDTFGEEFHRLDFGQAVERGLLADYKVLIVAVDQEAMGDLANRYAREGNTRAIDTKFAQKIIGAYKGLAKHTVRELTTEGEERDLTSDPEPMQRAVAFSQSIKQSKRVRDTFQGLTDTYLEQTGRSGSDALACDIQHVDGSMNAMERQEALDWLRESDAEPSTCRVLSNARCLSEGIDVPALDSVIFFDNRESMVDIVQAVGRVMRKVEGKEYGYIILPVGIPRDQVGNFDNYIRKDDQFKGIWKVIKALRAHDESLVDEAEFRRKIQVEDGTAEDSNSGEGNEKEGQDQLTLDLQPLPIEDIADSVYAVIPEKLGDREYWANWAKEVADMAQRLIQRIEGVVAQPDGRAAFDEFMGEVHRSISPSVSEPDAIRMLAQHVITRPVFDALFEGNQFTETNPVATALDRMMQRLDEYALTEEAGGLERFYSQVQDRIRLAKSDKSKQDVIRNLYDTFFQRAFPGIADRLGIVYTPTEVVDFINRSAQHALQEHFGRNLGDEGVHIIDPFAGTGMFLVRMLQLQLMDAEDLPRKMDSELHANEIVLLAYYIATINIETAYHEATREHRPFSGMVLTDTFAMAEGAQRDDIREQEWLAANSERARRQRKTDIQVIVGNPPYSAWQESGHETNANQPYPALDERIRETYAAHSSAQLRNSLYDSYIRAIRWASDRIGEQGVVAFVTNGSFIDGNAADGLRKSLVEEFSYLYVVNLRGNQRTSGEESRREGGKVFGQGSRAPVAITLMVKDPNHEGGCQLLYHDIGDYLTREQKLGWLSHYKDLSGIPMTVVRPTNRGEWVNQGDPAFDTFPAIGRKKEKEGPAIFGTYSRAVMSGRDWWVYNFSRQALEENMTGMIKAYNREVDQLEEAGGADSLDEAKRSVDTDPARIAWDDDLFNDARRGKKELFEAQKVVRAVYRPFTKDFYYYDRLFNNRLYLFPSLFPTPHHANWVIAVTGKGAAKPFSVMAADTVVDLEMISKGQCFPLYWYEYVGHSASPGEQGNLLAGQDTASGQHLLAGEAIPDEHGYIRHEAITDWALEAYRQHYEDSSITKEAIFWYVYGLLHSDDYRERFRNNLRRGLPRIPFVTDFWAFSNAGRELGDWHLNYENVQPSRLEEVITPGKTRDPRVHDKMRFGGNTRTPDKTTIVVNDTLTLRGIPLEAYDYQVNGKSPIEWVLERYQVTTDDKSGITNDPNAYSNDPYYIVNLIKCLVQVSLQTRRIVAELPKLEIDEDASARWGSET
ncbi:DEAD/DEAH box helicase [Thiohalorhabdus methylotrophus]|uniref:DEAD/DEAH box helicase n=1 Tax=Thiohalorhabdus methylotrophus TaxID=3242694 RepID=A0ABV4TS16_9GAMM